SLSPMHTGMSYARLEELGGIQWPCKDETDPGAPFLHGRLWETDEAKKGRRAPFSIVLDDPPLDLLNEEFPLRLTTGRRLDSYNTGVQTGSYASPLRHGESLDLCPEDGARYRVCNGEQVRVVSRRGTVIAPVRYDPGLRPGLACM